MGRRRKPRTTTPRIRLKDYEKLKEMARGSKMSFPDYITRLVRKMRK